ncbi:MAG: carbohydrate kinase family protein [Candidatus Azambacteria bacterium]|nr:carbohydrate kinase family protein [Candidatus Azambacteria bacterium]
MNLFGKSKYDILGIGNITVDTFIRLKDAQVVRDGDGEKPKLCLNFADKIPYEEKYYVPAVGNAANAAVAVARLGLKSALIADVGNDREGIDCIEVLKKENVGTEFITTNNDNKTNHHFILWFGDDRTILVRHEKYNYILPNLNEPKWIYLSSLGEDSLDFHNQILNYLNDHPKIKLAFQPGTFQIKFGREALAGIYKRSDVFFCNKEEAQRILENNENDILKLLKMIADLGPKIVVITDGVKGAYSYDSSTSLTTGGAEILFMPPYPDPKPPLERTGAGDAFSSTFVAALALGMDIKGALKWAPINPMSVVQQVGAQAGLLTRKKLEEYLAKAPTDYEPKILE